MRLFSLPLLTCTLVTVGEVRVEDDEREAVVAIDRGDRMGTGENKLEVGERTAGLVACRVREGSARRCWRRVKMSGAG